MASICIARPIRSVLSSCRPFSLPVRPSKQALQYMRSLNATSPPSIALPTIRQAHSQAQGRANGAKQGAGRRLGAKKTEQFVVPGNIIYRQRGTVWHPGENCKMGRDHTIYATEKGYVKYYRDPLRNPKKKYIGVALERDLQLPTPSNEPRRRRLSMVAVPIDSGPSPLTDNYAPRPVAIAGAERGVLPKGMKLEAWGTSGMRPTYELADGTILKMRENYMFREDNWQIGRIAERNGVNVRPYKPGDRWCAWRKRSKKRAKAIALRLTRRKKPTKTKKKVARAA